MSTSTSSNITSTKPNMYVIVYQNEAHEVLASIDLTAAEYALIEQSAFSRSVSVEQEAIRFLLGKDYRAEERRFAEEV